MLDYDKDIEFFALSTSYQSNTRGDQRFPKRERQPQRGRQPIMRPNFPENCLKTRMHSSRMRTVRSSGRISGVSALGGGCLLWGGVCSRRCLLHIGCLLPGGVYSRGCVCSQGVYSGGCLLRGVVSQHVLRQTPPPVPCGQTDACKNITFATSLRTVIKKIGLN